MTREQLLKHWAVIEAFRNGKQIEYRSPIPGNGWVEATEPSFGLKFEYRIKPEPKKIWVNVFPAGSYVYPSRGIADNHATPSRIACVEVTYTEGEGL